MQANLVLAGRYPSIVVAALLRRIEQVKTKGNRFGFEVRTRGQTSAVMASRWRAEPKQVPFSRVFNYAWWAEGSDDPFLVELLEQEPGLVVETLPNQAVSEAYLRGQGLREAWYIPWLHLNLEATWCRMPESVQRVSREDMPQFARVLALGYGYQGVQYEQWAAFFEHGYAADGFNCFWVKQDGHPVAGGVVFVDGDIAFIDGASTLETYRGRGLQKALLAARMAFAQQFGCRNVLSRTARGSISQTNLQTVGMSLLWESIAWRRP